MTSKDFFYYAVGLLSVVYALYLLYWTLWQKGYQTRLQDHLRRSDEHMAAERQFAEATARWQAEVLVELRGLAGTERATHARD